MVVFEETPFEEEQSVEKIEAGNLDAFFGEGSDSDDLDLAQTDEFAEADLNEEISSDEEENPLLPPKKYKFNHSLHKLKD